VGTDLHTMAANGMRPRILVLDDQAYLRDIMAVILTDAGYPARPVVTTEEAWTLLHEVRPELLVLDLSLPRMSGLDFLARVRAEPAWATLPVIVVSGDPSKLAELDGSPYVRTLAKPFDVTAIVDEVARFLAPAALSSPA